ncbi:MAG: c-type cytochrome [Luteitalea sp.]|nr:c-type cytochrome [Luteitalea sp.]
MKRLVGLSPFIFAASVVLAGAFFLGSKLVMAQEAGTAQASADPKAEEIYTTRCVACHGADGDSQLPEMSFTDGVWKHGSSEGEVAKTITDGVPGTAMMPFESQLSQEEIETLAKYVRQFDPKLREGDKE